ncbi:MAG: NUDIX hydrolase [Oscillospiraceae bacterium]
MDLSSLRRAYTGHVPDLMGARGGSAVLVPLVDTADGPSLLYEIRSATVRQPNEVCFPGGKTESGETAVQCALRETWEELSIPPEAVEVIGEMDFLHIRSNCLLRPVLGRVDGAALADIRPCAAEVADTFWCRWPGSAATRPLCISTASRCPSPTSPMRTRASPPTTSGGPIIWRCRCTTVCPTRCGV